MAVLSAVALMPHYSVLAVQGGCTNIGCIDELQTMSNVLVNGGQGCVWFTWPTARIVRNNQGFQGGELSQSYGTKPMWYNWYNNCAVCVPPASNGIAVRGNDLSFTGAWGSFGIFECEF